MSLQIRTAAPRRLGYRSLKDYTGQRFGRLVAVQLIERDWSSDNDHTLLFRCDCGTMAARSIRNVRSGHTSSCGCLARELTIARNTTHGLSRKHPREYRTWKDMRARCNNPNNGSYSDYGGRSIRVCERWDDFAAFFEDMGPRPEGMTLDRKDVDGDYEPKNCRWATHGVQANNKRSTRFVVLHGERRSLEQ
jgi:hypothetical protein